MKPPNTVAQEMRRLSNGTTNSEMDYTTALKKGAAEIERLENRVEDMHKSLNDMRQNAADMIGVASAEQKARQEWEQRFDQLLTFVSKG